MGGKPEGWEMTTDNWASMAFASVQRRGFHASVPVNCRDARLAAQFVRLVEEYLEWGAEFVNAESEMADVCIVAANMAALCEVDVAGDLHAHSPHFVSEAIEQVARAMRSQSPDALHALRLALQSLVRACGTWASQHCHGSQSLQREILRKLQSDEARGHLHLGKGATP